MCGDWWGSVAKGGIRFVRGFGGVNNMAVESLGDTIGGKRGGSIGDFVNVRSTEV